MRGARPRRNQGWLLALTAWLAIAAPAPAQVAEGVKRPGPVPYTELFGRRAVAPRTKARRPHAAAAAKAQNSTLPSPPAVTPPPPAPAGPPPRPASPAAPRAPAPGPSAAPPAAVPAPAPAPIPAPGPAPGPAAGPAIEAAALPAFVDGMVAQAQASGRLVGVAVAVVQNGQVVFEKGYGATAVGPGARPVDPRGTLFRLGSVSKVLTWIAVLKRVEAGRLKLDAPVDAALPPPLRPPAEGFRAPITLSELTTHTAGFEAREFGRLYRLDPKGLQGLDATLRRDRPRRVRAPGELSSYSSYDAALAGAMLEAQDHRPFEDVVEREVLEPAGLASTTFRQPYPAADGLPAPMPQALSSRLAFGHVWTPSGLRALPFEYSGLTPALAASSSADDMARLMLTLLARGRAPGSGAAVWGAGAAQALETGPVEGWTHGLMRVPLPGGREGFGHEGATLGFRDALLVVPSLGLGVFVAANSDTAEPLVRRLPGAIVARFAPPGAPVPAVTAEAFAESPGDLNGRVGGLYLSTRRAYHGLEGFVDRLTRMYRVRAGGDGQVVAGAARGGGGAGGRVFRATADPAVFTAADGSDRLRFRPGARGRPAAAFFDAGGVGAAERVGWLQRPVTLLAATGLATLAALLAVAGPFVRGRDVRQSRAQARDSGLQIACALLWLAAVTAFAVFAGRAGDAVRLYTRWPDPWLVSASVAALLVAAGTVAQLVGLLSIWEDARRLQGWTGWRKLRHTLTVLSFLAATFVLAAWGALEPWSS